MLMGQPGLSDLITMVQSLQRQVQSLRADRDQDREELRDCRQMLRQLVGSLLTDTNNDELLVRPVTSVEAVERLQQRLTLPAIRKRAVSVNILTTSCCVG